MWWCIFQRPLARLAWPSHWHDTDVSVLLSDCGPASAWLSLDQAQSHSTDHPAVLSDQVALPGTPDPPSAAVFLRCFEFIRRQTVPCPSNPLPITPPSSGNCSQWGSNVVSSVSMLGHMLYWLFGFLCSIHRPSPCFHQRTCFALQCCHLSRTDPTWFPSPGRSKTDVFGVLCGSTWVGLTAPVPCEGPRHLSRSQSPILTIFRYSNGQPPHTALVEAVRSTLSPKGFRPGHASDWRSHSSSCCWGFIRDPDARPLGPHHSTYIQTPVSLSSHLLLPDLIIFDSSVYVSLYV